MRGEGFFHRGQKTHPTTPPDETDDARRVESTVVQLAGPDRPGLLADVTALLAARGCDVRSAAVWTHTSRVAAVLSVTEKGRPVTDSAKLAQLGQLLESVVNDGGTDAVAAAANDAAPPPAPRPRPGSVTIDRVRGDVHHDRRLHRLLLEEAAAAWAEARAAARAGGDDGAPSSPADSASSLDGAPGPTPLDTVHHTLAGTRGEASFYEGEEEEEEGGGGGMKRGNHPTADATDDDDAASAAAATSPRPAVRVAHDPRANYWVVTTVCADRPKLLFDTLCTLADLDYDVFHASVDAGGGGASSGSTTPLAAQEFFVRPRHGGDAFEPGRADQLAALVGASIVRRFPRGLKVHVRSLDRYGCLASLTAVLRASGLTVTRAKVRTYAAGAGPATATAHAGSGHTFYVMGAGGTPPDRAAVEAACAAAGGRLVDAGDEVAAAARSVAVGRAAPQSSVGSPAAFSFSFRNGSGSTRRWAGWRGRGRDGSIATHGASPGSDASSF